MSTYAYWNRQFDSLVQFAAPELAHADKPTPIFDGTIADLGIDPDAITWAAPQ